MPAAVWRRSRSAHPASTGTQPHGTGRSRAVQYSSHSGERQSALERRARKDGFRAPTTVDGAMAVLPKGGGFVSHFFACTFDHGRVFTIWSLASHARRAWPIPSAA